MDLPAADRPREKISHSGPAALSGAELIAIFLRTGIRGRSAIQLGQDLLKHYGSLREVGNAGVAELSTHLGLGTAKAAQLVAAFELGSRAVREKLPEIQLTDPRKIHEIFSPELAWLDHERLMVALLDTRLRLTSSTEASRGTVSQTVAHPRDVLRPVVARGAYGFVLVHNHPSGDPTPSKSDFTFTRRVSDAADLLQLRFLDHVIIGRPEPGREPYYSFREAGLL